MQEEKITPDLTYRNQIVSINDAENEIKENRIIFNHRVNYQKIQWNEDYQQIKWGNGLIISIRNSNDYNYKNFENIDIINYLLPIDNSVFFYNYSDYTKDNEYSYLRRDWTFNKNKSNPYHKLPVFGFKPQFNPDKNDPNTFFTFGLEDIFNKAYEISNNFDLYVNSMFIKYYKSLFDNVLGNVPETFRILLNYNININPIQYIVLVQLMINNGNDFNTENLNFDKVVYSQELLNSFNEVLVNSEYLFTYNSLARTPDEKRYMMNLDNKDSNKEYGFKKLSYFKEEKEISFIKCDLVYNKFISSLEDRTKGIFRGIAIDTRLKILIKIFLTKNKLINDINDLFNYFLSNPNGFDRDLLNSASNYSIINDMLNKDKDDILNIFNNDLMIKNYTNVYNPDNLSTNTIEHSMMSIDFYPISAFYSHYEEAADDDDDISMTTINERFVNSKFKFSKSNYIEGKSLIFNYLDIRITLNKLKGLNSYDDTCRVYFSDVMISFKDEGIMLSDIESNDYPYYVAHFIHSSKDFLLENGESREKLSVVKLEFKPEMNILKKYLPKGTNQFTQALLKIFSTTFYIKTSLFKNQFISFSKVIREDNSFVASPKQDSKLYYTINKNFTSNLYRIVDKENTIDIGNDIPVEYKDIELVKSNAPTEVLKDDEFNLKFKYFDNDFIVKKRDNTLSSSNSIDDFDFLSSEEEEEDRDEMTAETYKPPKIKKNKSTKEVNYDDIE